MSEGLVGAGLRARPDDGQPQGGAPTGEIDTGLVCLLILARFYGVPADGEQLRHLFGRELHPVQLLHPRGDFCRINRHVFSFKFSPTSPKRPHGGCSTQPRCRG